MNHSTNNQSWWESLRHIGLLLSPAEVQRVVQEHPVGPLPPYLADQLRRDINRLDSRELSPSEFVSHTMPTVFGFAVRGVGTGTGPAGTQDRPQRAVPVRVGQEVQEVLWEVGAVSCHPSPLHSTCRRSICPVY